MKIWETMLNYRHIDPVLIGIFFGTFIPGWILVNTKPYETIGACLLIPCLVLIIISWLPPVRKIIDEQQNNRSEK